MTWFKIGIACSIINISLIVFSINLEVCADESLDSRKLYPNHPKLLYKSEPIVTQLGYGANSILLRDESVYAWLSHYHRQTLSDSPLGALTPVKSTNSQLYDQFIVFTKKNNFRFGSVVSIPSESINNQIPNNSVDSKQHMGKINWDGFFTAIVSSTAKDINKYSLVAWGINSGIGSDVSTSNFAPNKVGGTIGMGSRFIFSKNKSKFLTAKSNISWEPNSLSLPAFNIDFGLDFQQIDPASKHNYGLSINWENRIDGLTNLSTPKMAWDNKILLLYEQIFNFKNKKFTFKWNYQLSGYLRWWERVDFTLFVNFSPQFIYKINTNWNLMLGVRTAFNMFRYIKQDRNAFESWYPITGLEYKGEKISIMAGLDDFTVIKPNRFFGSNLGIGGFIYAEIKQ